ncbi:hypothetical protein [Paenimyroides viscosum]|uniref:DUF5723 domain-containing protein n=1 Tax=Paenimyroides viscosum TaxID=2488729 RepID=A0A3P1B4A9_9FLAO|nr:hypothetical protein [Paenimyroides viscosum]RRA95542.1 hypothetical protein EG242_05325 [Paenimyroides viscosum]
MKKNITLIAITILFPALSFGQVFLETLEGDEITLNPIGINNGAILGSLNSSEQSLQFKSVFTLPNKNGVLPNQFVTLSVKGKPSDGIATLFSGGNFNPSTAINLAYSKIHLFSDKDKADAKFIDFFTLKAGYNVNKQTLFKSDTLFKDQINDFTFEGLDLSFNYNALLSGKNLLTVSIGYAQKNNYSKLDKVEIKDFATITDSLSGTSRTYSETINGRMGNYKEYESFPFRIAYTSCPSEFKEDENKMKFGYTLYYSSEFGNNTPAHNLGALLFLTKQSEKTGIRTPVIGLGIQANDISDNLNKGNNLTKRVTFNLTTTFNLTSL